MPALLPKLTRQHMITRFDRNLDGWINADELHAAEQQYFKRLISRDELIAVRQAYENGTKLIMPRLTFAETKTPTVPAALEERPYHVIKVSPVLRELLLRRAEQPAIF